MQVLGLATSRRSRPRRRASRRARRWPARPARGPRPRPATRPVRRHPAPTRGRAAGRPRGRAGSRRRCRRRRRRRRRRTRSTPLEHGVSPPFGPTGHAAAVSAPARPDRSAAVAWRRADARAGRPPTGRRPGEPPGDAVRRHRCRGQLHERVPQHQPGQPGGGLDAWPRSPRPCRAGRRPGRARRWRVSTVARSSAISRQRLAGAGRRRVSRRRAACR